MNLTIEKALEIKRNIDFVEGVSHTGIFKLQDKIREINEADDFLEEKFRSLGAEYKRSTITLTISSYGGDAYAGFAGYDIISKSKSKVNTVVNGTCMSAAFLLFLAGTNRSCSENSTFMYHEVATFEFDKLEGMKRTVKEMKNDSKN